jgi:hypothetical protein
MSGLIDDLARGLISSSDLSNELAGPEAEIRKAFEMTTAAGEAFVAAGVQWQKAIAAAEKVAALYGVKIDKGPSQ